MELQITYDGNIKKIILGKTNMILGLNNTGKTRLCEILTDALRGAKEHCYMNGQTIQKGMFNVIFITDDRDLKSEAELKLKSVIQSKVLKEFISENDDKINIISNEFLKAVQILFDERSYPYLLSHTKLCLDAAKLEKLQSIIFDLEGREQMSQSAMEEFYLRQRIDSLDNSVHNFVVIDNIDQYLDSITLSKLLLEYKDKKNLSIVATAKNQFILEYVNIENIYLTNLKKVSLLEEAKIQLFDQLIKKEQYNATLDDFIMEYETFFKESDYIRHLNEEKLKILSKIYKYND